MYNSIIIDSQKKAAFSKCYSQIWCNHLALFLIFKTFEIKTKVFFYFVAMCKLYQIKSKTVRKSIWFWLVSRPTNCPVNFSFFLLSEKKIDPSVKQDLFFVHSLDSFVQSRYKNVANFLKRLDKKFKDMTKKDCPVSAMRQFSYGQPKKKEKFTEQLVGQWD